MTHVIVEPGVCGLVADVKVETLDRYKVKIDIDTKCKMIAKLVADLGESVDAFALLGMSRGAEAPLLDLGRRGTRIHAACPVMAGIAKAVEAECQLALPRDAHIRFVQD